MFGSISLSLSHTLPHSFSRCPFLFKFLSNNSSLLHPFNICHFCFVLTYFFSPMLSRFSLHTNDQGASRPPSSSQGKPSDRILLGWEGFKNKVVTAFGNMVISGNSTELSPLQIYIPILYSRRSLLKKGARQSDLFSSLRSLYYAAESSQTVVCSSAREHTRFPPIELSLSSHTLMKGAQRSSAYFCTWKESTRMRDFVCVFAPFVTRFCYLSSTIGRMILRAREGERKVALWFWSLLGSVVRVRLKLTVIFRDSESRIVEIMIAAFRLELISWS